jgi:hypothetical protein
MIDLTKVPKEELKLAEEFAIIHHYPDSIAKGLKDKKTGEYIEEAETTMQIFLAGLNAGKNFAKPVVKKSLPKPKIVCLDCGRRLPSNYITPYCYGCG